MNRLIRYPLIAAFLLVCVGYSGTLRAQTPQPWDTNVLTWVAPTTCSTGEPISACAVTGYRVFVSSTPTGTPSQLALVTTLTYSDVGVTAGQHCYRIVAVAATGESVPSNTACKTNVKPVGPPNPPVLTVAQVVAGVPYAPLYRAVTPTHLGTTLFGFVPTGRDCGPYVATWRGRKWYLVTTKASDLWYTSDGMSLAAPCA